LKPENGKGKAVCGIGRTLLLQPSKCRTAAPENPEKNRKDRIAFLTAYSLPDYIEETRVWVNDTLPRLPTLDIGRGGVKTKGGADGFD